MMASAPFLVFLAASAALAAASDPQLHRSSLGAATSLFPAPLYAVSELHGAPSTEPDELHVSLSSHGRQFNLTLHRESKSMHPDSAVELHDAQTGSVERVTSEWAPYVGLTPAGGRVRAVADASGNVLHAIVADVDGVLVVDAMLASKPHWLAKVSPALHPDLSPADLADAKAFSYKMDLPQAPPNASSATGDRWNHVARMLAASAVAASASAPESHSLRRQLSPIVPDAYHGPYGRMCPNLIPANTWKVMDLTMVSDIGFGRAVSGSNSVDHDLVAGLMTAYINTANFMYTDQLGIMLRLSRRVVQTSEGGDWNLMPSTPGQDTCGVDEDTLLQRFGAWRASSQSSDQSGLFHLLTNCFPAPGTIGLAYVGTTCLRSNAKYAVGWASWTPGTTWSTVAHEIGHNFGGHHEFDTNGIMSYSNTPDLEFTGQNPDDMCAHLSYVLPKSWNCFKTLTPTCGNGIVEPGEDCDDHTTCCSSSCTFTHQCSPTNNECCSSSCTFLPGSTACGFDQRYCTRGRCAANTVCDTYSNTRFCNLPAPGKSYVCDQHCKIDGSSDCYPAYWFGGSITRTKGAAEDGTVCSTSPYKECHGGACVSV
mmetsp:Transcript_8050/g.25242  ORF Transcript_8050/g.25242 Transcript_8050/m.25242 type:complete len:596 (-) Transcript_8050:35-1822(-)